MNQEPVYENVCEPSNRNSINTRLQIVGFYLKDSVIISVNIVLPVIMIVLPIMFLLVPVLSNRKLWRKVYNCFLKMQILRQIKLKHQKIPIAHSYFMITGLPIALTKKSI